MYKNSSLSPHLAICKKALLEEGSQVPLYLCIMKKNLVFLIVILIVGICLVNPHPNPDPQVLPYIGFGFGNFWGNRYGFGGYRYRRPFYGHRHPGGRLPHYHHHGHTHFIVPQPYGYFH
ncbi:uncharacterized protein [Palaemon carinicauda]|uniref:uncharacterized protein n=1 Tax=Palaemon carinicauda TaxID=392227 RepID=UPI0035B57188